jgi:hypothetical protein
MSNNGKEKTLGVYLSIETIGYEEEATELPIIIMGKWHEANSPGTLEVKPMWESRLLVFAKNEETAAKATKNLRKMRDKNYENEYSSRDGFRESIVDGNVKGYNRESRKLQGNKNRTD